MKATLGLRVQPGPTLATATLAASAVLLASATLAALTGLLLGAPDAQPRNAIQDSPGAVLALFAHNVAAGGIPLALAAFGWDRTRGLDGVGDAIVAGSLIANGALVGWTFARAGIELAAYLPHLPFEWTAIALPAAAWLCLRRGYPDRRALLLQTLGLSAAALLIAALLEVYAAPLA